MTLTRESVELLAPAGNFEVLKAAVDAGADAVYLGGKHFNMRLHRQDMNFSDEELKEAIKYTHEHGVRLYITINNLISEEELPDLEKFLQYLDTIKPDAILVQDFAVIELVKRLGIKIPLHASIMMNTHNEHAVKLLQQYGITRVVASREMSLTELSILRERTGIEVEYFVHGDMCISESGQCIHSGVLFGQSGNRGRCLKPCRWPYELLYEDTLEKAPDTSDGPYKLALKDMCMYRNLPDLIQAGVASFKIEGRMRPAPFVHEIVSIYRRAIDAYIADPTGYQINEDDWRALYNNRARDFSTCFAMGHPDKNAIGFDGTREPRFFSKAIPEAKYGDEKTTQEAAASVEKKSTLAVRVRDMEGLKAAIDGGADAVYAGGEVYAPAKPWTLSALKEAIDYAHKHNVRFVLDTPRTTTMREVQELELQLEAVEALKPDGILLGNPGSMYLAEKTTSLPLQTDFSLNLFNHTAAEFFKRHRVSLSTVSYELSLHQLTDMAKKADAPLEVIVHGAYESMICDHDFPSLSNPQDSFIEEADKHRYAFKDETGAIHSLRRDQYGRTHILFTNDLCLYPYLPQLHAAVSNFRIEAQDMEPELVKKTTALYKEALNKLDNGAVELDLSVIDKLEKENKRPFGIGAYRFAESK